MKLAGLAQSLTERLLLPLMRGGEVRLVEPVGEARAVQLSRALAGARLFDDVDELRLEAARRWAPVDDLGDVAGDEWLLLAALNDLLQLTNPALAHGLGRGRARKKLARLVARIIDRAGPPSSVRAALSRHALFCRVVELARIDTEVRWWTGSDKFVGRPPPDRLLAWPNLRLVRRREERIRLGDMAPARAGEFDALLERWLLATPLTTLGTSRTSGVPFRWTGSLLGLTQVPAGRRLALRVLLSSDDVAGAIKDLSRAAEPLAQVDAQAHTHARAFIAEAEELRRGFAS